KLNTDGNFVWARTLTGSLDEVIGPVGSVDGTGNIYTYGGFRRTATFGAGFRSISFTSRRGRDDYLIKFSPKCNVILAFQFGGPGDDAGDVRVDSAGTVYSFGTFTQTVDFDPGPGTLNLTSAGSGDIFVMTLSQAGDFIRRTSVTARVDDGRGGFDTQSFTID